MKKRLILAATAFAFLPFSMAEPVIGNNVSLKAGLGSVDGYDTDSAIDLSLRGHYFIDNALYAVAEVDRFSYGYDQFDDDISFSLTRITGGAGYEYPLPQMTEGLAAFGEGRLVMTFTSEDGHVSVGNNYSDTNFGLQLSGGMRYAVDQLSGQADITIVMISGNSDTSINLEGGYEVLENIIAGGYLSLGDITAFGASASYKF